MSAEDTHERGCMQKAMSKLEGDRYLFLYFCIYVYTYICIYIGKKRRESSKRNDYIISPRVIIKAIIIICWCMCNAYAKRMTQ